MSLSLERETKPAPFIQLRPDALAAPEAQPPMQVIRRNGAVSRFDAGKISVAMTKAFLAVEGHTAAASRRVHEVVEQLTDDVVSALSRRASGGRTFHIEDVQDQVELALMRAASITRSPAPMCAASTDHRRSLRRARRRRCGTGRG
jgi:ribonucleoside-diphosphate reductase alpha chain